MIMFASAGARALPAATDLRALPAAVRPALAATRGVGFNAKVN